MFGEAFYEKDAPAFTPPWVKTAPVPRRETPGGDIRYILINDLPTLVWVANLGTLELHPFLHRAPKIDRPTAMVFDCDPGEGANILHCARVALMLREVLHELGLDSYVKVSGSKGLQVYVPLNSAITYDETQPLAKGLADLMAQREPKLIVSQMAKRLRAKKVFIDWSQNTEYIIPKGQYGGGTVMVWDIGTYELIDGNYYKGMLRFYLNGMKLKGEWTIKRFAESKDERDNRDKWQLIKTERNTRPVSKQRDDESALTHRTMAEIAAAGDAVWQSNRT